MTGNPRAWPTTFPSTKTSISRPTRWTRRYPRAARDGRQSGARFTFKGTLSYIIARAKVAIVDPGPNDPRHIGALLDAVRNETVTHIFVTHTHRDHSPQCRRSRRPPAPPSTPKARIARRGLCISASNIRWRARATADSKPDVMLKDGEVVSGDGCQSKRGDARPHRQPHGLCAQENNVLFAGDHVMGWATSIVAPPDAP